MFIAGEPAPKGSWRSMRSKSTGKQIVVPDNPKSKPWQRLVSLLVYSEYRFRPLVGAVRVSFEFLVHRPKRHYGTGRNANRLKASAPEYAIECRGSGDLDKLVRGMLDAMEGVLYDNDKQVISFDAKREYSLDKTTGVMLRAFALEPEKESI